jgi:hypothetical protein
MLQDNIYLIWIKENMLIECSARLAVMIRDAYTTIHAAGLELIILTQPKKQEDD